MVPHDPRWASSYLREARRLEAAVRPWLVEPIEHIGSTAVPGLIAKPIIDIVAVIEDISVPGAITEQLLRVDWVPAPEPTDGPLRKLSYCTPSVARRTHHLHVVERTSSAWRGWVAFRDHLRSNPQVAAEYADLKARLAESFGDEPNHRGAYRAGKADWIAATTARAMTQRE